MHELPQDLNNSLRSWRGNGYEERQQDDRRRDAQDVDLEKGVTDYGEKQYHGAPQASNSSFTSLEQELEREYGGRSPPYPGQRQQRSRNIQQPTTAQQLDGVANSIKPNAKSRPLKPTKTEEDSTDSLYGVPTIRDIDPAAERLARNLNPLTPNDFYELMGLFPPNHNKPQPLHKLAKPDGLFARIHKDMTYVQRKYRLFDIAAYIFLVLQLIISAIFIILGSLKHIDSHLTIAILGAVATVISGALALMKGQGLPNRLRQSRDSFQTIMFEAEELWTDVRIGRPVLYKDVKKLREDYLRVLQTERKNHPDTYNDGSGTADEEAAMLGARRAARR